MYDENMYDEKEIEDSLSFCKSLQENKSEKLDFTFDTNFLSNLDEVLYGSSSKNMESIDKQSEDKISTSDDAAEEGVSSGDSAKQRLLLDRELHKEELEEHLVKEKQRKEEERLARERQREEEERLARERQREEEERLVRERQREEEERLAQERRIEEERLEQEKRQREEELAQEKRQKEEQNKQESDLSQEEEVRRFLEEQKKLIHEKIHSPEQNETEVVIQEEKKNLVPEKNIDDVAVTVQKTEEPKKEIAFEDKPEENLSEDDNWEVAAPVKVEFQEEVLPLKQRIIRTAICFAVCLVIAYSAAVVITHFIAGSATVEGQSMEPTLSEGDNLIIDEVSYRASSPKRYDIVSFPVDIESGHKTTYYIKRIIGLPGETIQILNGKVYINNKLLADDVYSTSDILDPGEAQNPITLKKHEYFVLGDNRNMSTDSRNPHIGVVKESSITGKAWRCIWPISHWGNVYKKGHVSGTN